MKKPFILFLFLFFLSFPATAETLKMKDGSLVSGSILSQTEYTLNLATSYGNITLNQREIEEILPDKHRLILKGGSQLVGIILDMDEFNIKLQTDDGTTVNVDVPQVVSIEAYDYNRGQNAQQEFVEQKIEEQKAIAAATAVIPAGTPKTVEAAGGLNFDADINQVFNAQNATVVNGQVQTPQAQPAIQAAPRPMSEEEAFLKNVKTGAVSQQEYAAQAKKELQAKNAKQSPKKTEPVKHIEKNYSKYFSIQAGAMPLDLTLDNSAVSEKQDALDVGGTSVLVSGKFLWRIKESRLWLGPTAAIGNIPNHSFTDYDPVVQADPAKYPDPTVSTNGQILSFGAAAHYYINPKDRFAFYLTGSASYEMLSLNYRGERASHTIKSNGFAGAAGVGVETWVDDLMIGLEVRQVFASRQDELKKSASSNTVIQAQLSWKF